MHAYLQFIRKNLPADWAACPHDLLEEFARHAQMLRETVPWCAALPEEDFLHYVLCPRVNDEDLSSHRPLFYTLLWDRVKNLTQEEAVLAVNRWCAGQVRYEAQDDRTASPLTVFRCGSGRCGEESAFLVSALRSVGLAARQVYAPRWSHCDDNHAWVEVLCGGAWRFLGACEPEPILDRGWFNTAASRAMAVRSRTFEGGRTVFHYHTARYAPTAPRVFQGTPGEPIVLQVLNEASFQTVAELTAGPDGTASLDLGLGDIHMAESEPGPDTGWIPFDFHAPAAAPVNPAPLDGAQRARRAEELAEAAEARRVKTAPWPRGNPLLEKARGNWPEIAAFLGRDANPYRQKLLESLAEKDLRDSTADLLEYHLRRAAPYAGRYPDEIYVPYVLCPRVGWERLTVWSTPPGPVAALRARGIPARLRPLDGALEIWREGRFVTAVPEETGKVCFTRAPGEDLRWNHTCSLARWTEEGWRTLSLSDGGWRADRLEAELPAGRYRVITTVRLPSGDQQAASRVFTLGPGEALELPLLLRKPAPEDLLFSAALPLPGLFPDTGKPALLLWLEPGAEPTEHVLNELAEAEERLAALPLEVVSFRPGGEWAFQVETVARHFTLDPERPPLLVLCGRDGRAVWAAGGYSVGMVGQALALAARICEEEHT